MAFYDLEEQEQLSALQSWWKQYGPLVLLGIAFGVAASAYLLFIAVLDAGFPHGVIEKLFS